MNTYYKLISNEGVIIFSNLPKELEFYFEQCNVKNEIVYSCKELPVAFRHGKVINESGISYLLCTESEAVNRPRYFKEKLTVMSEHLLEITLIKNELKKDIQANNRRLVHNITSFNAHNIQELYLIVPENKISKDYKLIKETVKQYLYENPDGVADAFLRIAKNSIAMKAEFTVFKKLDGDPSLLQFQLYDIRRVILTVLHVFYQDFNENDVYVIIDEAKKYLRFEFETIRVALYHIIDNTAKYILPGTQLRIRFEANTSEKTYSVILQMTSMEIKPEELSDIYNEGYSGIFAKKSGKNGDGLGLAIVKRILALNKADLIIYPNQGGFTKWHDGINYTRNNFEIRFNE